jgi:DNA-binding NarL/FixJ family response regulator
MHASKQSSSRRMAESGASATMEPLEVVIISHIPLTSWAIQKLFEEEPAAGQCRSLSGPEPRDATASRASVIIIAPRNWQEMARWMPHIQTRFQSGSWLLYAELRVAGLFSSFLEAQLGTIVGLGTSIEEFKTAFRSLTNGSPLYPPAALLTRFAQGAPALPSGRPILPLTPRELQCGCAISLGLTNHQVADILHIGEAAVKGNLYRLYQKLEFPGREAAGALFELALSPLE